MGREIAFPMKKSIRVIDDPRYDRLYKQAYAETLKEVEHIERTKEIQDYTGAFLDIFRDELEQKDLTPSERDMLIQILQERLIDPERTLSIQRARKKRVINITLAVLGSVAALSVFIYVLQYRPFTSYEKITTDLTYYLEKVDKGFSGYARKYYNALDDYKRRLSPAELEHYNREMYTILDAHFTTTLESLESGTLSLYDDAKDWAKSFPEAEEQKARKEMVDNTMSTAVGRKARETYEAAKEEAGTFFEKVVEGIKKLINGATAKETAD